jgi:hypothetical protein
MKKERIIIEGDRYLIYYTFDDEVLATQKIESDENPEPPRRTEGQE